MDRKWEELNKKEYPLSQRRKEKAVANSKIDSQVHNVCFWNIAGLENKDADFWN